MFLKDLEVKAKSLNILLVQCSSSSLEVFIKDTIKSALHCNNDSVITVNNKSSLKEACTLGVIKPFVADKWLFVTDLAKTDMKVLKNNLKDCKAGLYYCVVSNYRDYKFAKKQLKDVEGFDELYLAYLKRVDLSYLYNRVVPEDNRLTPQLYDHVAKGYSGDIEAIFKLFQYLEAGDTIKSKSDITKLCGIGGNSVDSLVLSFLKSKPKTASGLKRSISDKVKSGADLAESLSWSDMWKFSYSFVKNMIYVKELYISGVIYDSISQLPEGYDESRLVRLNKYFRVIKEIQLSKLLGLAEILRRQSWRNEMDYIAFVYTYYKFDVTKRLELERKVRNGSNSKM